ncbi:pseudouridine synthase [Niabella yanshanensis]|uniref:Pseudouridine synthase n=1 Tax=Niabella yanshanensis TaxID=577386 RepID=A0ABZ0W5B4_9BACT|nr:pseudouridine synthase [Niabella yanshanensis]WQD37286.1 pseudouridine synthase [Niabella yanshanensis]
MKKIDPRFQKFAKKKSNAAIKEGFKQEKRKYKKERAEFFEQKKKEAREKQITGPVIEREKVALEQMPLNKYLAHGGVSSRREAADLIKDGNVKVNGNVITEPGYKMADGDEVTVNGKKIFITKNLVYILVNKPKDYITTTDDPQKRKTVLDLIKKATQERVYPVGRLDRNTSGVLLITNDGELAQKLTHPSNEVKKIYAVTLDKPLEKGDFDKILKGVTLEDGPAYVDVLAYSDANDRTQIGVEIHSGRNRIVRRIFESQGYDVKNLDRVMFAGLTKKNVERGKFRFLTEKEVRNLKYFGKENKKAGKGQAAVKGVSRPTDEDSGLQAPAKRLRKPVKKDGFTERSYSKPASGNFKKETYAAKGSDKSADKPFAKQKRPAKSYGNTEGAFKKEEYPSKGFAKRTGKPFKKEGNGEKPYLKTIGGGVKKENFSGKAPAKKLGKPFKKEGSSGRASTGNYKSASGSGRPARPRRNNNN